MDLLDEDLRIIAARVIRENPPPHVFVKISRPLTPQVVQRLREAWSDLWKGAKASPQIVVLDTGIELPEPSEDVFLTPPPRRLG